MLIATPGRLLDLFERGNILMSDVKILVIDEADRMLDMGFIPDVEEICSKLPAMRQTLFFSATMPPEIRRLADKFLSNPKEVTVARPATTASTIEDFIVNCHPRDKRRTLRSLLSGEDIQTALVFCNRKRDVDVVARSLKNRDFNAAALHGDMTQEKRTETLERFRSGDIQILVASDVAARGLDIDDVSHVFNFDVPMHPDDYVHRIGRTGRAGKSGRAYTLATRDDEKFVDAIHRVIGRKVTVLDPEVEEKEDKPDRGPDRAPDRAKASADPETDERPARESRGRNRRGRDRDDRRDDRAQPSRQGRTAGGQAAARHREGVRPDRPGAGLPAGEAGDRRHQEGCLDRDGRRNLPKTKGRPRAAFAFPHSCRTRLSPASRRLPCGLRPWPFHSAPGSCLRAARGDLRRCRRHRRSDRPFS